MVNRARRQGASAGWNRAGGWEDFVAAYGAAMERKGAAPMLRFSDGYFSSLRALADAELVTIDDEAGLAAAAVMLWGPRFGHYHLAVRRPDAPNWAASFVLQAALERAHQRGLAGLHLGGGTTNDPADPLLRFKRSLGGRLLDFQVARVVADEAAFADLVAQRTALAGAAPTWLLGYRQPF
jgi:hypothetical protein